MVALHTICVTVCGDRDLETAKACVVVAPHKVTPLLSKKTLQRSQTLSLRCGCCSEVPQYYSVYRSD